MTPRSEIEARFTQSQARLNTHRKELVQAILDSPSETFFLSSRQLAQRYGVDPATIVRTIQALGYERFADFAADLRQHFVTRLTPYQIMEASARVKGTVMDHVLHSLERDSENVENLRAHLNTAGLLDLAKRTHRARRIVVIGVDLAATLSSFLAYGLLQLGFAAEAPLGSSGNLYHKIRTMTDKDLLIAVSFGRCLKETVDALRRARERGVLCYGITDSDTTPIARYADHSLIAATTSPQFTGSYVAPLALCNAILVTCAHIKPKRSLAFLRQSETEYRTGPRWFEDVPEPSVERHEAPRRPRRRAPAAAVAS
jgi:RpiR family transcriptional regulator, carbohydrate utilization regulator